MDNSCTVSQTVRYLTKKWTFLIILELYKGESYTRRFSDLKDALPGITPKILSERLKEMEEEGIIGNRIDADRFPVKSEYYLTESGVEIVGIIKEIKKWALKWKIENIPCQNQDCRVCVL